MRNSLQKLLPSVFECLMGMSVSGDDSSFQAYTTEWTKLVNRGGLFEVNDLSYQLFKKIEIQMQKKLLDTLNDGSRACMSTITQRESIINAVASNEEVQFFWAMLCCDIHHHEAAEHLLKELISLWLTIRGFSIAGTWIEQYKARSSANIGKKKGLRKELKQT